MSLSRAEYHKAITLASRGKVFTNLSKIRVSLCEGNFSHAGADSNQVTRFEGGEE